MTEQATKSAFLAIAVAFLGGAVVGLGAGLLFAPKTGRETRRDLQDAMTAAKEELLETAADAKQAVETAFMKTKQVVNESQAVFEAARKAGRHALKTAMD